MRRYRTAKRWSRRLGAYRYLLAYRFSNGEIEGFRGVGPFTAGARQDAFNQAGRKCQIIRETRKNDEEFEFSRVIRVPKGTDQLTHEEYRQVARDWNTSVRY